MKSDHRSSFSNLSNWKQEAWKMNLTGFEPVTSAKYRCDALPTELWSHTLGARPINWVHIFREEWNDAKYIRNNSYLNCGCRWKWRMIISVNFPIWVLKLYIMIDIPAWDNTNWKLMADLFFVWQCCYHIWSTNLLDASKTQVHELLRAWMEHLITIFQVHPY